MAIRISNPAIQHFDKATGAPLSGGEMFFFEPNGSTTPKDTFADFEENTTNTNPVVLDANGLEPDIFGVGSYRVVLRAAPTTAGVDGVQQWERDPVDFETSATTGFSDWLSTITYGIGDIIKGSDGNLYVSILSPNLNNDPTSVATAWTQWDLLRRWNTNETYQVDDVVRSTSTGIVYTAVQISTGVDPDTDTDDSHWLTPRPSRAVTQQVFTSGGVWSRPDFVTTAVLEMVGGGGGGGGADDLNMGAQGGGGGGYSRTVLDVTALSNFTISVGTGGAGGIAAGGNGTNGVSTQVTTLSIVATAGSGGNASGVNPFANNGGLPTGGDINVEGGAGGKGNIDAATTEAGSGYGGSTYFGGGPNGVQGVTGVTGITFGTGGSGGSDTGTDRAGGDGAPGIAIVTEYR